MKLPFDVTPEQQQQFEIFFKQLIETNKQFNLTAITDESEVIEKHFFDSAQAVDFLKQNASVVDVGAGAGFPSVPLKILMPSLKTTLIDSLNKRVNFLMQVGEQFGFYDYNCVHSRAEDFAVKKREQFDVALARAVAPLPTLCELAAPLVKVGGQLIFWKGSDHQREIDQSKNAFKKLGLVLKKIVPYRLENANQNRVLIIINKIKATPAKYPRGQNKPKTNPL